MKACAYFDIQGSRIYSIARRCDDGSCDFLSPFSDEVYFVFGEPNETNGVGVLIWPHEHDSRFR